MNVCLPAWTTFNGSVHAPHTMLADEMQLDTLYWPIVHTEQVWHVVLVVIPAPVEYRPVWHVVHEAEELTVIPDEYVPDRQDTQSVVLVAASPVE